MVTITYMVKEQRVHHVEDLQDINHVFAPKLCMEVVEVHNLEAVALVSVLTFYDSTIYARSRDPRSLLEP